MSKNKLEYEERSLESLQREKVQSEINEFTKPWYKKDKYISILITTGIALATIIGTLNTNYFSALKLNTDTEKMLLEMQRIEFKKSRDSVHKATQKLKSLTADYNNLIFKHNSLKNKYESALNKEDFLRMQIDVIEEENSKIKNALSNNAKNGSNIGFKEPNLKNNKFENGAYDNEGFYNYLSNVTMSTKRFCKTHDLDYDVFKRNNSHIGSRIKMGQGFITKKKLKL